MSDSTHEPDVLRIAEEFISNTSRHIFLTGKAGTGKTTFLKRLQETCRKQLVVVAPTGVAAINAGGVTAHSFFQIPPGTFSPKPVRRGFQSNSAVIDRNSLLETQRLNNDKRELMQSLDLIIIDEVSMMRCDLLDAIDTVMRSVRRNSVPFGGVQMLFIGDLYQLPPVTKEGEWDLVADHYTSPFFFSAQALQDADMLLIELKKVYRQSDERFIHLLNRIRDNRVDEHDLEKLHALYQPAFRPKPEEHFITLTTHNYKADEINARELRRLPSAEIVCHATVEGEFPDRNFPVEGTLRLKPGAQIMFVRNDTEEKKYFNGKIGVVKSVEQDDEGEDLLVEFPETDEVIRVGKVQWRNIRYSFNEEERKIHEEELGSFVQFPVRLAWAVTIHKSQGLTFERAVIDAGSAFAAGQVYVALSRCTSMEGIKLLSRLNSNSIMTDPAVVQYMSAQTAVTELLPVLEHDKQTYLITKAMSLFDMMPLIHKLTEFTEYMSERKLEGKDAVIMKLHSIRGFIEELETVAEKFRKQIREMVGLAAVRSSNPHDNKGVSRPMSQSSRYGSISIPPTRTDTVSSGAELDHEVMSQVHDRMTKGKSWFEKQLDEKLNSPLAALNKELQSKNKVRKALKQMKTFMRYAEHFTRRFSSEPEKRKSKSVPRVPDVKSDPLSEEHAHDLFELLRTVRAQFAYAENIAPFMVCHDSTLREMARCLPQDISDLSAIKGMGDKTLNKYGEALLTVVQRFCSMHGLTSRMDLVGEHDRTLKAEGKRTQSTDDTKTQSFKLFRNGKSVQEIADERGLTVSTIEGHLAHFVKTGELDVLKLVVADKFDLIRETINRLDATSLTAVKQDLGDAVTYSEIRYVMNAVRREPVPDRV